MGDATRLPLTHGTKRLLARPCARRTYRASISVSDRRDAALVPPQQHFSPALYQECHSSPPKRRKLQPIRAKSIKQSKPHSRCVPPEPAQTTAPHDRSGADSPKSETKGRRSRYSLKPRSSRQASVSAFAQAGAPTRLEACGASAIRARETVRLHDKPNRRLAWGCI